MVRTGKHLWHKHPGVNNDLTVGERAADVLKRWFGTWTALFTVFGWLGLWMFYQTGIKGNHGFDPYPWLLLNIILSCIAAVQGIVLQISANRQDRINAEAATHDRRILETLLDLQKEQMTELAALEHVQAELNVIRGVVCPAASNPAQGTELEPDSTEHGDR